jgi:hypothetical protein
MVTSFAQRSGCRAAKTTPTMPPRLAPTQVTGILQPQPSSHAATRSARPATEMNSCELGSSKPFHVEPLPGHVGHNTVYFAGSMRSGAHSAGHHAARGSSPSDWPSPNGNGDAVMPPTIRTAGAVPSSGP